MKVVIPAASLIAGATAGALTYTTFAAATEATATSVYMTTTLTRIAVGRGISLIAGPTTAAVVETAITLAGHGVAVPTVRRTGLAAATLASVAAAATAVAVAGVTATLLTYIGSRITSAIKTRMLQRQPPVPLSDQADIYVDKEFGAIVIDYDPPCPINL
jgi:hypothetical protein